MKVNTTPKHVADNRRVQLGMGNIGRFLDEEDDRKVWGPARQPEQVADKGAVRIGDPGIARRVPAEVADKGAVRMGEGNTKVRVPAEVADARRVRMGDI
jgi:hypothetical protein